MDDSTHGNGARPGRDARIDPEFTAYPLGELADVALQRAAELGAQHADFRAERVKSQRIGLSDGHLETQFDADEGHHDPASSPDAPRWFAVDIAFDSKLARPVTLPELRADPPLADMVLLRKGSRLSVKPVSEEEWNAIVAIAQ